ncbi:uncharacterized protein LOC135666268 [Musa acuminata AAA Group]|uniref:uncharacterized protein LOC135666207 n=1 Tax=Musa acuminata AAA Group TaxID=214697 RepID=UPI0031CF9589
MRRVPRPPALRTHPRGSPACVVLLDLQLSGHTRADHHYALLQRETEKLRVDIEKMRSELRSDMKSTRCIFDELRDELAKQRAETTELITKLDREILALRAQLDAAKHDAIKLCIGILVSMSFKAAAFLRRFL